MQENTGKIERYLEIGRSTKKFAPAEIEILREVLEDWQNNPDTTYIVFDEEIDSKIVGFIIFGLVPLTKFSWDIYWIAVDGSCQGKGIGRKLLQRTEDYLLRRQKRIILRAETSGKKEYAPTRAFYIKTQFKEALRIPDFYDEGDDLMMYTKHLPASK